MIPYSRPFVEADDIQAVVDVLRSGWLTTGPSVAHFEQEAAHFIGCAEAVAVNSGTAALHAIFAAINIGAGDEVILPTLTFLATANSVVLQGGTPVFADVRPDTLLMDPNSVERLITSKTRAVVTVDYAGQPSYYEELLSICESRGVYLISDACHALGAEWGGRKVGTCAKFSAFSFHPTKPITTGEGGLVATDDADAARKMRVFRNHGMSTDGSQRHGTTNWSYEMLSLGLNYRISDISCALGISQLRKLPAWQMRRSEIARQYGNSFNDMPGITPLNELSGRKHAWHLYVVKVDPRWRDAYFTALRGRGLGVNVHYFPVHLQPYYRRHFATSEGLCPVAEREAQSILSLPLFPAMTDEDVQQVIEKVAEVIKG